ncbi:GlxA family transcriptional regulator [Burkholderia sp. L27(2015)]|uniref:GlxA family transcriptional regulator n=1 Tax=Burkholderia sp. L27(2015) TaxID=1641858 RepID=UPI00131D74FE|nr:GlxA family transcriptional regulator [Burkholderia sp. L27(2015)]
MRTVALIIFAQVQALDVVGPLDVLIEANNFVEAGEGYDVTLVGTEAGAIRASNGMRLTADLVLEDARPSYDMLLVAGGPALPEAARDARLCDWLVDMAPRCRRYGSICTGAFLLGHAGLLDGKTVTTHWQNAPRLAELFPAAQVEFDRIYIRDGALLTSAGVTAGIDLTLALVAQDHGAEVALAVAKRLVVVAQRQGGQSQFSPLLVAPKDTDSPVAKVQAHVMAHIRETHSVEKLAEVAGMSARNFARVFVQEAKVTPAEFIERVRVDAARNRLEASDLALKAVAYESGFGSADRMRIVFTKRLGVSPGQYRASFRTADPA